MSKVLLEILNLSKHFKGNYVLHNINLNFFKSEVHTIIGENGAGKTVLMNILSGMYRAEHGQLFFEGNEVIISSVKFAQRLGIHMIHHDGSIFPNMSAYENILLIPNYLKKKNGFLNRDEIINKIYEIRDKYELLDLDLTISLKHLDFAQQKIIEIIKAIIMEPKILILDEPTVSMNKNDIETLFRIIKSLKKMGTCIIYITNEVHELDKIADKISILRDGRIIKTKSVKQIDNNSVFNDITGINIKDRYPKLEIKTKEEVLRVENLSDGNILKNISFNLHKSEIIGFAGLKGSGKTTIAKCLFGIIPIKNGNVFIKREKLKIRSTNEAIKNGICYVTDSVPIEGLIQDTSIANNITITNLKRILKLGFISKKREINAARKYINELDIKPSDFNMPINYLSSGNKKKVLLSKWLFSDSMIFILNNPVHQIDITTKVDIYNILNELIRSGASIILISSDFLELAGLCDRIFIIKRGKICEEIKGKFSTQYDILNKV